jgi:SAM-dependent methyltransferase
VATPDPKRRKPAAPEPKEREHRRALSHVGGKVELFGGSPADQRALLSALAVKPDESATLAHVHGFHSYPAKLHPETARGLIEGFSKPGASVLDPFCGSGTVLVEAQISGRRAFGVDANPLAVEIGWLKTHAARSSWVERLEADAARVVEHAEARRAAKAGPTHLYGPEDRELFAQHVLLELDSLCDGIERLRGQNEQRALGLVISAILTKVSLKAGDSSGRVEPKRIAGGNTIRLFMRKTEELVRRAHALDELLPDRVLPARIEVGDARKLVSVRSGSIDLVVSSPPYAGVYDYFEHHKVRLRWLGLGETQFERTEIGARRQARRVSPELARERFSRDFAACLGEIGRVLAPTGRALLIVADSVLARRALYADDLVAELAPRAGLAISARASQPRPHFHEPTRDAFSRRPRSEHVILLEKSARTRETGTATRGPARRDPPRGARGR